MQRWEERVEGPSGNDHSLFLDDRSKGFLALSEFCDTIVRVSEIRLKSAARTTDAAARIIIG